jgi:hypothetical protein
MSKINFRKEIDTLQETITKIEKDFIDYSKDLQIREKRWLDAEKKIAELQLINKEICTLNIGGKPYDVSLHTLRQKKHCLFAKQILRHEIIKGMETFYDRDHDYFDIILQYLRTGKFKQNKLSDEEKEELLAEAEFYEINYILEILKATPGEVEFVKMDFSGEYRYDGKVVGTNDPKDLTERDLTKGK